MRGLMMRIWRWAEKMGGGEWGDEEEREDEDMEVAERDDEDDMEYDMGCGGEGGGLLGGV